MLCRTLHLDRVGAFLIICIRHHKYLGDKCRAGLIEHGRQVCRIGEGLHSTRSHTERAYSHTERAYSLTERAYSHAAIRYSRTVRTYSHAVSANSHAERAYSYTERAYSHAERAYSHAERAYSRARYAERLSRGDTDMPDETITDDEK